MISLDIAGRSYALDLWWQVREGAASAPRKAMLALAREKARVEAEAEVDPEIYDCVVVRRHQFGLGRGKECIGQASLAAAMRPTAMTFLGMFCLRSENEEQDGLWWVCAIRQGSIAGDGDMAFSSREKARRKFRHLLDLLGKCDLELTCETPEESLAAITPMLRPDARVEDLFPPSKSKKYTALAIVLVLILAGTWFGKNMLEQRRAELEQSALWELATRNQTRLRYIQEHPEELFPLPMRRIFLADCLRDLAAFPAFVQGWKTDEVVCEPGSLSVTFRHDAGASFQILPPLATLKDTTTAVAVHTREMPETEPQSPLLSEDEATRHLYQLGQDTGLMLRSAWQARATHALDKEIVIEAPWREGNLEIEIPAQALFSQLPELLEKVPGFCLTSVTASSGNWIIKGVVYVR